MKFFSRKFLISIALILLYTLLLYFEKINSDSYLVATIVIAIFYDVFNSVLKIQEIKFKNNFLEISAKEVNDENKNN